MRSDHDILPLNWFNLVAMGLPPPLLWLCLPYPLSLLSLFPFLTTLTQPSFFQYFFHKESTTQPFISQSSSLMMLMMEGCCGRWRYAQTVTKSNTKFSLPSFFFFFFFRLAVRIPDSLFNTYIRRLRTWCPYIYKYICTYLDILL